MACKQPNDATIQVDVFDILWLKVLALAQWLENVIDECYDNKMLEKATMQIKR